MAEGHVKDRIDEGSWGWKQRSNNNRLIAFQEGPATARQEGVELSYFGGSCFRITTPAGLSVLIDPWRNPPWGNWDWYLYDFPGVSVDLCVSTHAHFDHDGVHAVDASMVVERPVGSIALADAVITGIADKHVSESSHNAWDWAEMTRRLTPMETRPPDNWRSFDNSLVLVEAGGLRILHWGDNRPDPPDAVWDRIDAVDIALLPIDGSQHVLSYAQADEVARRLQAKLIVPHHYGIWDVTTRGSTLLPPDEWVNGRPNSRWVGGGSLRLTADEVDRHRGDALCFGEHVAFEKPGAKGRPVGA
jgi:L-ascorbate metabolism protein UlaG (beta-lactamase superfamily)